MGDTQGLKVSAIITFLNSPMAKMNSPLVTLPGEKTKVPRDENCGTSSLNRTIGPAISVLSLSFRLRRHIHQSVLIKHRAIEVTAAVVVLHAADRCGDATRGKLRNGSAQRNSVPAAATG
jgi:hypothetical protein